MGYIRHDTIVATSWNREMLSKAHSKAKEIGLEISEIVDGRMNGQCSFLIAPDGSKEGWRDSDEADAQRQEWKEWIKQQYETLWVDWEHVSFGGDDPQDAHLVDFNKPENE